MGLLLLVALPTSLIMLTSPTWGTFHSECSLRTRLSGTKLWLWVIKVWRWMHRFGPGLLTIRNHSHRLVLLIVIAYYRFERRLTAHTRHLQSCLSRLTQLNTGGSSLISWFLPRLGRWLPFILACVAKWNLFNMVRIPRWVPWWLLCLKCWSKLRFVSFHTFCVRNAHLYSLFL